jgi:hypothetical protein
MLNDASAIRRGQEIVSILSPHLLGTCIAKNLPGEETNQAGSN